MLVAPSRRNELSLCHAGEASRIGLPM